MVQLTFDHVGLTPGDRYEAFVSPEVSLDGALGRHAAKWEQGFLELGVYNHGGHQTREQLIPAVKAGRLIMEIRESTSVDDAYFSDPARVLATLK